MNKSKILKVFLIFIAIQPILDLITSVTNNYINPSLSFNVIIKMIFILFIGIYLIFYSKSKYKKISIIYLIILAIYGSFYFLTKLDLPNISSYINELNYLFKFNYYVFIIIGYLNIFDDTNFENKDIIKYVKINTILYFTFLIIPLITKTSLYSYDYKMMGIKGWFNSANEMASILSLLFPMMFLIFTKERRSKSDYICLLCSAISLGLIGLKTSFAALIITIIFFSLYYLIKNIKSKKIWIGLIMILISIITCYKYIPGIDIWQHNNNSAKELIQENDSFFTKTSKYLLRVRRDLYFEKKAIYDNISLKNKLFGLGFNNRKEINNERVAKLVEIDFVDIFFCYGIIGLIIYILPFIYLIVKMLKYKRTIIKNLSIHIYSYIIILAIIISIFAGHIFGAPSASIYVAIAYTLMINKIETKNKNLPNY